MLEGCSFLIKFAMFVCGSSDIVMRSILVLLESLLLLIYYAKKLLCAVDSKGVIVWSALDSFRVKLPAGPSPAEEPLEVESFLTDVCAFTLDFDNKLEVLVICIDGLCGRDGFFSSCGCFGGNSALLPDGYL